MIERLHGFGMGLVSAGWWTAVAWPVIWTLIKIVVVVLPLMGAVAYLTLWERKAIGFTQIRVGPNRVGPLGLLQPIADALKLLTKEIIIPTVAEQGPVPARADHDHHAGAGRLGGDALRARRRAGQHQRRAAVRDGDHSLEVYGVIIAGWASNSKYAFLGALRASAQMVSYEVAMGFASWWC